LEPSARYKIALDFATAMDHLFRAIPKRVPKDESVDQSADENEPKTSEFAQFDFQQIDDSYIVHLHDASVLSAEAIAQSQNELFELVESYAPHRLIINFASVQFCSSATVGILIQLKNQLKSKGTQLYLCEMRESIREVFRVLNLDGSVFEIRATVANALKSAE
jgi:anti-anti-sigma factor